MRAPAAPDFFIDEERPHLGGYIRGGDPATYYPELWTWLVHKLGVRSVIDVGCGEGHALDFFASLGCTAFGVDGVPQDHPSIVEIDYTLGPFALGHYDLAWSCEFVEHVEEQYVPNFMATFRCANIVLMTHAEPGQPGYHHVNCQSTPYWVGAMVMAGFDYDPTLTADTRRVAAESPNPINHYVRSGLAFRRSDGVFRTE